MRVPPVIGALLLAMLPLPRLPAHAQTARRTQPPRLIVLVVVDQMRRDYVDDYGRHWKKGLRLLLDEGAWFPRAAFPYMATLTCAGHASIATGSVPARHGIVSNQWWSRERQQVVSCTSDSTAREVPYGSNREPGPGGSAAAIALPTFASSIAAARPGSRVVSISLKRAGAAMMAGTRGDAVLWFQGGGFSSSTAYAADPQSSLDRFVARNVIEEAFGERWLRLGRSGDYRGEDDAPEEKPPSEWSRTFPHALHARSGRPTLFFYEAWQESPFSDEYLGRMAEAAIDGMKLGRGEGTDVLAISFSALDVVGHDFGPRSHEVQDVLRRLDETLGRLITRLDRRVGRERYVLAFSADHGVAAIPEQLAAEHQEAGRIRMNEVMTRVEEVVSRRLGQGRWVATQAYTELYFRHGVFERIVAEPGLLAEVITAIVSVPGVDRVLDSRDLAAGRVPADAAGRAAAASFYPARSGDLVIIPKRNWIYVADDKTVIPGNATTHGSPYPYDTDVPLALLGAGIAAGRYDVPASPIDIAPTVAHLAGVPLPTATGRVLTEALASSGATR